MYLTDMSRSTTFIHDVQMPNGSVSPSSSDGDDDNMMDIAGEGGFKRVFACTLCSYHTDRKNNLKRHTLTMHELTAAPLECCGIKFPNKSELRQHTHRVHRDGYHCEVCGRVFCRKALLKRHFSVHSGLKEFSCRICGYETSHKSNLERHMRVHRKEEDALILFGDDEPLRSVTDVNPTTSLAATLCSFPSPFPSSFPLSVLSIHHQPFYPPVTMCAPTWVNYHAYSPPTNCLPTPMPQINYYSSASVPHGTQNPKLNDFSISSILGQVHTQTTLNEFRSHHGMTAEFLSHHGMTAEFLSHHGMTAEFRSHHGMTDALHFQHFRNHHEYHRERTPNSDGHDSSSGYGSPEIDPGTEMPSPALADEVKRDLSCNRAEVEEVYLHKKLRAAKKFPDLLIND